MIIFADEPTGNLDTGLRAIVQNVLRDLSPGRRADALAQSVFAGDRYDYC